MAHGIMSTSVSMDIPGDSNADNVSKNMRTKDLEMEWVQTMDKIDLSPDPRAPRVFIVGAYIQKLIAPLAPKGYSPTPERLVGYISKCALQLESNIQIREVLMATIKSIRLQMDESLYTDSFEDEWSIALLNWVHRPVNVLHNGKWKQGTLVWYEIFPQSILVAVRIRSNIHEISFPMLGLYSDFISPQQEPETSVSERLVEVQDAVDRIENTVGTIKSQHEKKRNWWKFWNRKRDIRKGIMW